MVDLLTTSMSCLLYFSGSGCRLIVPALTTLLAIPMMFSLDAVSFPSQMPGRKRCSSFGKSFAVGSMYWTVSPNSQIGVLCSLFHLLEVAGVAICVDCVPVE